MTPAEIEECKPKDSIAINYTGSMYPRFKCFKRQDPENKHSAGLNPAAYNALTKVCWRLVTRRPPEARVAPKSF